MGAGDSLLRVSDATREGLRARGHGSASTWALAGGLLVAPGCNNDGADTGFRVVNSYPTDAADDVVVSALPEFRLNAFPDAEVCHDDSLGFVALRRDGAVAFEVPFTTEIPDDDRALRFVHDAPLISGTTYALFVEAGGDAICADIAGHHLRPFGLEFTVP
jgi:hypothetical protein